MNDALDRWAYLDLDVVLIILYETLRHTHIVLMGRFQKKLCFRPSTISGQSFGIKEFSDVILEVEGAHALGSGARFNCHKVILAAASKTFKELFCSEELKVLYM